MPVSAEESVVKAIAGNGGRSMRKRLTNSAAICCASAALPPLPKINNLLPLPKAVTIASTAWTRFSIPSRRKACLTRTLSSNARAIASFMAATEDDRKICSTCSEERKAKPDKSPGSRRRQFSVAQGSIQDTAAAPIHGLRQVPHAENPLFYIRGLQSRSADA